MLIDKKKEEMFIRCREHKKTVDKKLAAIRAALLIPPAIIIAVTVINVILNLLSEASILMTGAGWWGYKVNGSSIVNLFIIIAGLWLIFLCAAINIWRMENIRKKKVFFYLATFGVCFLMCLMGMLSMITPGLVALMSLPLSFMNEKYVKEDEAMSTLEGYPHFNPILIRNTLVPSEKTSEAKINEMTPDEKIMFEREGYDHRNQY